MEHNEPGRFNLSDGWLGITRPEPGGNGRQLTPGAGGELPTTHAADGSLSSSPSRVAEEASIGDGAESFFDHLRRHSLLTAWEEVQLAKRIEQGDAEARQRMITANLRLVVSLARRHQHRGEVVLADRIQDGIVGLIVAVDRFDWRRAAASRPMPAGGFVTRSIAAAPDRSTRRSMLVRRGVASRPPNPSLSSVLGAVPLSPIWRRQPACRFAK